MEGEAALLRTVSVFAGVFDIDDAALVAGMAASACHAGLYEY